MPNPSAKDVLRETLESRVRRGSDMAEGLPALIEFVRAFASPEFVCAMHPLPPAPPAEYPGADGLERAWRDWADTFETVRVFIRDLREGDDALVLLGDQIAVTRHGNVEIKQPSAMLFLFSDAGLARIELHLDRDAALEAGGLISS